MVSYIQCKTFAVFENISLASYETLVILQNFYTKLQRFCIVCTKPLLALTNLKRNVSEQDFDSVPIFRSFKGSIKLKSVFFGNSSHLDAIWNLRNFFKRFLKVLNFLQCNAVVTNNNTISFEIHYTDPTYSEVSRCIEKSIHKDN